MPSAQRYLTRRDIESIIQGNNVKKRLGEVSGADSVTGIDAVLLRDAVKRIVGKEFIKKFRSDIRGAQAILSPGRQILVDYDIEVNVNGSYVPKMRLHIYMMPDLMDGRFNAVLYKVKPGENGKESLEGIAHFVDMKMYQI